MMHCTASRFPPDPPRGVCDDDPPHSHLEIAGRSAADRWAGVLRRSADPNAASTDCDPGCRAEVDPLRAFCRAVPTPSANPGYTQLDPTTGLHVTGQAQTIDLASYRLKISGRVNSPLELTFDELRCLPKLDCDCTIICPGFFADRADWAGASLADVLKLADVQRDAKSIELIGADGYSSSVTLDEALADDSFLANEWAGKPVPILHGFPVRAVFPRLSGGIGSSG